eukprot:2615029-Rhodomonas_salina.1
MLLASPRPPARLGGEDIPAAQMLCATGVSRGGGGGEEVEAERSRACGGGRRGTEAALRTHT